MPANIEIFIGSFYSTTMETASINFIPKVTNFLIFLKPIQIGQVKDRAEYRHTKCDGQIFVNSIQTFLIETEDAAGFKQVLYTLGSAYTGLEKQTEPHTDSMISDRSVQQILKKCSLKSRIKIYCSKSKLNPHGNQKFNFEGDISSPFIVIKKIPREQFLLLKDYAKKHHAKKMDVQKNKWGNIRNIVRLEKLFDFCSYATAYHLLKKHFSNLPIAFTNIGILDKGKLIFVNCMINDASMTGSIKYIPNFQLSLSTFDNKATLCVNLYGTQNDRQIITGFLNDFALELQNEVVRSF